MRRDLIDPWPDNEPTAIDLLAARVDALADEISIRKELDDVENTIRPGTYVVPVLPERVTPD